MTNAMAKAASNTRKTGLACPFWLAAALLFSATVLVYLPATRGGFIWDDGGLLTDNPAVKSNTGLLQIWFSGSQLDYVPMTTASFWLEWRLWHMNPMGYHVTNIFLHGISVILLWRVLDRLRVPGGWFAALLFAVHPVCVMSVAWIIERKNTLSLAFYFASLLLYLRFEELSRRPRRNLYAFALASFACAVFSKSSAVVLPMILLLFAWWQRGRIVRRDVLLALPFFAVALVLGIVAVCVQNKYAGGSPSLLIRLISGSWAFWFYIGKIIYPVGVALFYPLWKINPSSFTAYIPALLAAAMLGVFWRFRRSWGRPCLFAFGYFIIVLGPVLGIFKMAWTDFSPVSDHLQYLGIPAIIAFVVACVSRIARDPRWLAVSMIVVALPLSAVTWRHEKSFANLERLWQDSLDSNPDSWRSCTGVGTILNEHGKTDEALALFRKSIQIHPGYLETLIGLGVALDKKGQYDESILYFQDAIKADPSNFMAHKNLALVLARKGDTNEAIAEFIRALTLKRTDAATHMELGNVLGKAERVNEAQSEFMETLKLDPDNANAHNGLGASLDRLGHSEEAIIQFHEAIRLKPDFIRARLNLAELLTRLARRDEAIAEFKQVLALQPKNIEAAKQLAALSPH